MRQGRQCRRFRSLPPRPDALKSTAETVASADGHLGLRQDIQALRGLAVLWVLLYHAQLPGASGGYLGVDIFFVISGFLITGLIQRALQQGRFSFLAFYGRRARRLLPAAYVVVGATLALAPWVLNRAEQLDLVAQALGALGFASNVVLWQQTGYFQGASELKPLLHFWSLALEEQYYLLLPALLVFSPARWRLGVVLVVTLLSLALLAWWQPLDASGAFYLLPTRAWELGLGSVGALLAPRLGGARVQSGLAVLAWPAWLLLVIVPASPQWLGPAHPGPAAAVVGLATLVLLLRLPAAETGLRTVAAGAVMPVPAGPALPGLRRAQQVLSATLVALGDWSYSLYLLHWPLLAFIHNAWVGSATQGASPLGWRLGAVLLALPLAWALHRAVELPAKAALTGRRGALVLGSGTLLLALGAGVLWWWPQRVHEGPAAGMGMGVVDFTELRRPNYGLSANCDFEQPWDDRPACRTRPGARWLLWGDSFAMHLAAGLVEVAGPRGLVQATKSSCGPFPGVTPVRPELGAGHSFAPPWIAQCEAFNASVLAWVARHPEIDTVLLSSRLTQYLDEGIYQLQRQGSGERLQGEAAMRQALREDLARTVAQLRRLGKRVLWVAPPPSAPFDIAACLERRQAGRWTLGAAPGCAIDPAEDASRRAAERRFVDSLDTLPGLDAVLRFEPLLCDADRCEVVRDGMPLYRDAGHLSHAGARWLMPRVMPGPRP